MFIPIEQSCSPPQPKTFLWAVAAVSAELQLVRELRISACGGLSPERDIRINPLTGGNLVEEEQKGCESWRTLFSEHNMAVALMSSQQLGTCTRSS